MNEKCNPNEMLVPVYVNEKMVYVTPPEYYAKYLGGVCLNLIEKQEEL